MKVAPYSVDSILKSTVTRLAVFGLLAIVIVFASQFFVLSYQSHRAACEIVAARFSQFAGPLSRELALNDSDIAVSIFEDFKRVISDSGAKPSLTLKSTPPTDATQSAPVCTPSILGASVEQPVTFAGKRLGVIEGRVTYFPTVPLLFFVVAVVIALILSVRSWTIKLIDRIQTLLVAPIKELSQGHDVGNAEDLPVEVRDVSRNIETLKNKLIAEEKTVAQLARDRDISEMAVQVAHDIRSPLSILTQIDGDNFKFTKANQELMAAAARRIQGIAQSLIQKYSPDDDNHRKQPGACLVSVVIESIVSEKKAEANFQGINISTVIDSSARNSFAPVSGVDLGRSISNILNNAIQAFGDESRLTKDIGVRLSRDRNRLKIAIYDNGRGIDAELLPLLGEKGSTTRAEGLGLGLFLAKSLCAKAGGKLVIESEIGHGATISFDLPEAETPTWFAGKIQIPSDRKIVLIDDDEAIHRFWKFRFGDRPIRRFYSGAEPILQEISTDTKCFFLVDYQLGAGESNGLELIAKLRIANRSVLVTSRFEDIDVQQRAMQLNVKIVPKQLLGNLELLDSSPRSDDDGDFDLVLIDDDSMIRQNWRYSAEDAGLRIAAFETVDDFLAMNVVKTTPIFLDQFLGRGVLGQDVALILRDQGYLKIHLATGDSTLKVAPDCVLSIRNKSFPTKAVLETTL